jgi:tetratricopeptide (TPR) repeat protein
LRVRRSRDRGNNRFGADAVAGMTVEAPSETKPLEAQPTRVELFRSSDFVVRAATGFDPKVCEVTFDSYTDERTLDRSGFGEDFFADRNIDAIHVIPRVNDWYQHEDILAICAAIAEATGPYARVYAYGSSMGGYAAIRFGGLFNATAIALSPQYSIDRRIVPFEHRWTGDAQRIRYVVERSGRDAFAQIVYVCYDPIDLDRRHVELLRGKTSLIEIPIAHAGHPVTGFLAEAGLLGELVLGIVNGTLDIPDTLVRARAARKRTPQFWSVLADRAREPKRRVAFAGRALSLAPGNVGYQTKYARALALDEDFASAEALFAEALETQPTNPVLLFNLSEMYEWRGDTQAALDVARRLVAAHPDAQIFDDRIARLTNRRRLETVASGLGRVTPERVARPIRALYRRMRERMGARPELLEDGGPPIEILVTTTPSPPPFVHSWLRHVDLVGTAPDGPVDLMLVGDSHVHYWPPDLWGGRSIFNFGVAADKTQHTLWRLLALADGCVKARDAVLMLGVNNLGADDTAAGIAAGVAECVEEMRRIAPAARLHIIGVPPCGEALEFRNSERRRANALIRSRHAADFLNADALLALKWDGALFCYQDDRIHLTVEGYAALTQALISRLKGASRAGD